MIVPYKSQLRTWWNNHLFPAETYASDSTSPNWSRRQGQAAWVILFAASLCVLLPNLAYPLIEPDETRYAEIAIGMNSSRDWVNPMLDGQPYLDKPPLMYWLTAFSFKVFGTNEIAARLPSLCAALLTIASCFLLGNRIVGQRAAWLGSMSLALCGGFVLAGRFLILDSLLALFTTLCFFAGYIAVREQHHRWAWWMVSGIACALGVLTKGPVALVLCAPPLIVNGWLRADQTRTRVLHWVAFVVPMILVCVPWYVAVMKFNPQFVDYFFWEHNFKRFTEGSNHQQPFWFYVPVLFASMFPASLLLPSLGWFVVTQSNRKRRVRSKDLGFLFCGSAWVLLFFSIASCKLPTYILPSIPLIALMMGVMIDRIVLRSAAAGGVTKHLRPFPQRASLILVVSAIVILAVDAWFGGVSWSVFPAFSVCLVMIAVIACSWNRPITMTPTAWATTGGVAVAVLTLASAELLPTIATSRSLYEKTSRVLQAHPDAFIVFFGEKPHGVELQIDRERVTYFPRELRDEFYGFLTTSPDTIVVTGVKEAAETRTAVAATHRLSGSADDKHLYFAERIDRAKLIGNVQRDMRVGTAEVEERR
jgi:dolichol-phosphate mannosyltransferase